MVSVRASAVLHSRSGDAALLARLRTLRGRGRVDSVFRGVLNLQLPDGELVSLAARGCENAPRTLIVDIPHWGGSGVRPGEPVEFAPGSLTLPGGHGGIRICLRESGEWNPILPSLDQLTSSELSTAARALRQATYAYGELGGMLGAAPTAAPMETAVCAALDHGRRRLVRAVRSSCGAPYRCDGDAVTGQSSPSGPDPVRRGSEVAPTATDPTPREAAAPGESSSPLDEAVLALLGLGPGLTPAGDDFLVGIAVLSAIGGSRLGPFARALDHILTEHPCRTTLLSTTTLREALAGRVRAPLVDVLRSLTATRGQSDAQAVDTIRSPVRRALAHGHTSGADTLSGLVTGLHLEKELRGSL
ncbi:oxamate carbamoyltransferase subunit AllH family protein [Streptomyces luteolus]|uniref:DUF2877 domain-containing protein n=1 Tax=Streptomyces luteolus TaxID=3043615 RepID=A0ABT6SQ77_9ACTN|nr:DUF2877 domain-containing protein [Streptomyces sp. B-S-A12]MDI3417746.1 DUF2877 domain-containing protein [Streptomyces sp. B-S-A12]